ncbi:DNA-binding Lrp family transcriptional regulator [Spinactinospora alkalitolerans]|uniref:DNA-binding Lrp family transcriptional regulator n=1 Tax=Spinactinospora alkalitolerans TaxID=687207 RepID=A0A852U8X2_9ACTN|nr:Lrp/AsnC family transcriptional regulator [Spinactinospora alkalitolerans]NYE50554.1 DNA-binding Lrp family transcriptional regulator [Spinactinospora alkalitolerans]
MELDHTDLAIVRELQADGRLAFESLAGRVGLSRAAARLRVQRLVDSGAIRVVGVVHPEVRGMSVQAHLSIDVEADAAPVAAAVAALPQVALVSLTAGRFPVLAELRGRGLPELTGSIERIRALPGVRDANTVVHTDVLKDPHLPRDTVPEIDLDETDAALLELLERDGRVSFADMAGRIGLSAGAVRSRVLRLLAASAVRVTALVDPGAFGLVQFGGFMLRLEDADAGVLAGIAAWSRIRFLARCLGRADVIGTVAAESVTDLHAVYERMRALPGVRVTETWVYVEPVKQAHDAPRPECARSG